MVTATDGSASDSTVVRWQGEADPRLRTAFRHVVAAAFATVGAAVFAFAGFAVYWGLAEGATDGAILILVSVLFGGPFALFYLVAIRREASLSELLPYELNLNPRYVLLATPVALVLVYGWLRFPPVGFVYLLGAPLVWTAIAARDSSGEIDVAAGTLRRDYGTAAAANTGPKDVRQLRAHASRRVGGYHLVRLRYRGSAVLSRPTLILVPEADFPGVDAALSEIESRDYGVEARETSREAKAFLAGFGLMFVAIAAGLAAMSGETPRALMPAAPMAFFGLLFVVLAWAS